jgi:sulfonate transport system substrate-binding protein
MGIGSSALVSTLSRPTFAQANNPVRKASQVLRIGYQKSSVVLNYLRSTKELNKQLAKRGINVTWSEFRSGPPMLEAVNAGAIDLAPVGDSPPIFAQAGGGQILYAAFSGSNPKSNAIIVQKSSTIRTLRDLKGKKVAFAKGSSAHNLIVQALKSVGLKYEDIEPVYLQPPDARGAFETGKVDAWSIWDPYYAQIQDAGKARVLVDGTSLVRGDSFYVTSKQFARQNPALLKTILGQIKITSNWINNNRLKVAKFLAPELGLDERVILVTESRRRYDILPVDKKTVDSQQNIADTFVGLGLIPKRINVSEAVWNGSKNL